MAVRVTADEVKEIIETSLSDQIIETFIGAANATINKWLVGTTLTDVQLKEIERWLTAHLLACTRERQASSEDAGGASITYGSKFGLGLDGSTYGQQVQILDTTGILASVGTKSASLYSITSFSGKSH